ncbi:unnamed protein product [Closterium sp. NIES-53]
MTLVVRPETWSSRGAGGAASGGAASGGAEHGGAEPGGAESEGAGSAGAEPGGAEPGGAEPAGVESGGSEPVGVELRDAESEGAESGGAEPQATGAGATGDTRDTGARGAGVGGTGGAAAAGPGGARTRGTGAAGTGGGGGAGAGDPKETGAAGAGGAGAGGTGAGGAGVGGAGAGGAGAGGTSAGDDGAGGAVVTGAGSTVQPRPYFVPLLQQVPDPESDRARAASPTVSHLLATAVTDPSFESAAASPLVAELLDFAGTCRLDYATALVAESASATPPSVEGECALGTNVLEDRQEDFECLAAAVPRFASMLLAPEGDPDAPDIPTPRSYPEAITGPYSSQWQAAMDVEMASWKSTSTYVDAIPSSSTTIVNGMWIFRVKRPPGSLPAFKARYVARGFTQRQGVDYFHNFSPTPKLTTLRVLLHVAAQRDYELHSLDFSTAFLQGSPHEEIWLRRPPGFTGSFPAGTQWSLHRPVYGIRQTPHEWHDTLRTTLAALGFTPSTADPSLARRTITLTQSHMVHQVLQRFGFTYSSPLPTPLSTGHSLSAPPLDKSVEPSGPYPELVGCLMYLMTCTRPDLAYPLSLLARYVAPGRHRKVHWDAAKRVLRYLCSKSGMGLVLGGRGPVVLTGHADTSWVDDSATQRSSQGYTFNLGSGSFSWRSTRSSSFLSSSCEAEIYARAMAAQELRWLTYLLTNLGEQPRSPPVLYVDNKATIALCQEHRLEHITKHVTLRYFLARELQQRGQLRLAYMATRANTVDIFTRALPPSDYQCFSTVLGLLALLFLIGLCDHLFSPTLPVGDLQRTIDILQSSLAEAQQKLAVFEAERETLRNSIFELESHLAVGFAGESLDNPKINMSLLSWDNLGNVIPKTSLFPKEFAVSFCYA